MGTIRSSSWRRLRSANPAELAERLVEAPVTVIGPEHDGAPQSRKHVLFYNPPLIDPGLGIRRSSSLETADLAGHFLAHGVQTIVFGRARLTTELILTYLRENKQQASATPHLRPPQVGAGVSHEPSATSHQPSAIRGYRGGYLPSERREIEKGLREGHGAGRGDHQRPGVGHRHRPARLPRWRWQAIRAQSPAHASRWAGQDAAKGPRSVSWWPGAGQWISMS